MVGRSHDALEPELNAVQTRKLQFPFQNPSFITPSTQMLILAQFARSVANQLAHQP